MQTVEILKNYNKERDSSDFRKHVEVGWLGAVYWGISFLTTELWRSYIMVTSVTSSVSTPLFVIMTPHEQKKQGYQQEC